MPEKPEVYGVYRGRVSNVLEFGCFVELQGFRKKAEGLVHTSNISKQRWVPISERNLTGVSVVACWPTSLLRQGHGEVHCETWHFDFAAYRLALVVLEEAVPGHLRHAHQLLTAVTEAPCSNI